MRNIVWAALLAALFCRPAVSQEAAEAARAGAWEEAGLFDAARGLLDRILGGRAPIGQKPALPAPPAEGVARIVSWNVQVFGSSVDPARRSAAAALLRRLAGDAGTHVLALQEVAHGKGAAALTTELPDGDRRWTLSFQDTNDSQDNGFVTHDAVRVGCERTLFASSRKGRLQAQRDKARHPPRLAHMRIGELDFTILTLHLTYDGGDADASAAELRRILSWLQTHLKRSGADPDVILAGDFNLPTRKGKAGSARGKERGWHAVEDILEEYAAFRGKKDLLGNRAPVPGDLVALVDERTSRFDGEAANNYDHFILSGDLYDEEYVHGSAAPLPIEQVHALEREFGARISDHYPIAASFRVHGAGNDGRPIQADGGGCH